MKKWNLIVDIDNCTNCNACVLACSDEHYGNEFPGYAAEMPKHGHKWMDVRQKVRGTNPVIDVGYLPIMCQHCDNAPCIKAARNNAVTKRADGIVIIDPEKSKGQKQIVSSCPFQTIYWNEEKQIPQKWIFDAHLLDQGWKEPRAQQICATEAITSAKVSDEEMKKNAKEEGLERLPHGEETKTRVWYKNLHRYTKAFIAGSVERTEAKVIDCVNDARIELFKGGQLIAEEMTDNYGDFKFDHLEENSGTYQIKITAGHSLTKTVEHKLEESAYLGAISL